MTTDIEHEKSVQETATAIAEPPPELEELLEFKRERVHGDKTRCPVCNLLVAISSRRCQHCESNIEANNALVRETLRHIDEMASRLDGDGRVLARAWHSIENRIKRMFRQQVTINGFDSENNTQHALTGVQPGDALTVVEFHGAWVLVRTTDGREGWVYSLSAS